MFIKTLCVAGLTAALGCSAADETDKPFEDCRLGELTGTWRFQYAETNGNCGAIADETVIFDPEGDPPPGCTFNSVVISADQCRIDQSFSCPLADGQGEQEWVIVLRQTGSNRLEGTGTLQGSHPTLGNCRSTYDINVTAL